MDEKMRSATGEEKEGDMGDNLSEDLGTLLRHYRTNVKGLSLKQLEEITQVLSSYINRLEKGEKTAPSLQVIFSLAKSLGIPDSVLMSTIFQKDEEREAKSISEVLIQIDFSLNGQQLNKEARLILIQINEFLMECNWNAETKVKELQMLSEMLDTFKAAT